MNRRGFIAGLPLLPLVAVASSVPKHRMFLTGFHCECGWAPSVGTTGLQAEVWQSKCRVQRLSRSQTCCEQSEKHRVLWFLMVSILLVEVGVCPVLAVFCSQRVPCEKSALSPKKRAILLRKSYFLPRRD